MSAGTVVVGEVGDPQASFVLSAALSVVLGIVEVGVDGSGCAIAVEGERKVSAAIVPIVSMRARRVYAMVFSFCENRVPKTGAVLLIIEPADGSLGR
ncbi:hypothetical protein [Rhodococcus sp. 14-2496-1d]|uniref:hypothetical protein n=1 Tax=Rhodococcus sp. 14-2496-1d TaxID=2023146 RepID=UPI00211AC581|nr:hypothetical protein [Rhodococcus sp. 14-2496-1d]